MIWKRSTLWLLISGVALLLTGCVWLRLLAFKEQLADLDRYVKVDDRKGLAFHFLEPVLYADDVRELLQMEPTVKTTNQNCQTWLWTFEKELAVTNRSEEHTSELSHSQISYAVFCLKKNTSQSYTAYVQAPSA